MQDVFANPPQWLQTTLTVVASLVTGGGIVKLYNTWLNRHKPSAEIHLTQANAAEVTVRANSTASDAVIRMLARLDAAQETIDRLRAERDAWQDEYDKTFVQRDQLVIEVDKLKREIVFYDEQMGQMRAMLKIGKKNYDDTQDRKVGPLPDKPA